MAKPEPSQSLLGHPTCADADLAWMETLHSLPSISVASLRGVVMLDYLPMYLCHVLASEEEYLLHVSLHELRKRGHIAAKAASVESST